VEDSALAIQLLTAAEKAAEMQVSKETLYRWRKAGIGPKYHQPAPKSAVRYWPASEEAQS